MTGVAAKHVIETEAILFRFVTTSCFEIEKG